MAAMRLACFVAFLLCTPVVALDCSTFDPEKIELITFDVFAALMDLYTSLYRNVAKLVPSLSQSQVKELVDVWVGKYGVYAGKAFSANQTDGQEPFYYVTSHNLEVRHLSWAQAPHQHVIRRLWHN